MDDWMQAASRGELPRREAMQTPEEVAAMLRLKALGWGVRRIAGELGCSHMTVRRYLAEGGWVVYRGRGRPRTLSGLEEWVAERFRRHAGNADVAVRATRGRQDASGGSDRAPGDPFAGSTGSPSPARASNPDCRATSMGRSAS
jgi:hypothetical protein